MWFKGTRTTHLRDGDRLLLHGFVDRHSVVLAHLVELVDADDTSVCEDHRPALHDETPLQNKHNLFVSSTTYNMHMVALPKRTDAGSR